MIELRQLRHVLALAEQRNFVRAAEMLHITQPSLSRSIQGIEALFGAPLFDRGTREVTPTPIGELVIQHARAFDLSERDLMRDVELAKGMEIGELHVGAGPFIGAALATEVLARMNAAYPRLGMRISVRPCAELPEQLRRRDIELCVADAKDIQITDDLEIVPLGEYPLVIVVRAGHPLAGHAAPTAQDLVAYPLAGVRLSEPMKEKLLRQIQPAAARRKVRAEGLLTMTCDHFSILKTLLLRTDAVTLLSPFLFSDELRAGRLVTLPAIRLNVETRHAIVHLRGRTLSAPAQAFSERLRAYDAEIAILNRKLMTKIRR